MNKASLLAAAGVWPVRALIATLRIRVHDRAGILGPPAHGPILWLFWHNRLFLVPYFFQRHLPQRRGAALTSASHDGEIIAQVIRRFGIRAVRGSSSRRGAAALLEMVALFRDGFDLAITPDGPRGPRYRLHPGIVRLAQKTGAPLLRMNIEFTRSFRLKSWDGFMIPAPFARADITLHDFHFVKQTTTPEEFEAERRRLEQAMLAVTSTR